MKTTLVNMHTCKDKDIVQIDRRSPFGNPFKIGVHGNRKEVIAKYRKYFYARILAGDFDFVRRIRGLNGKKLVAGVVHCRVTVTL